MRQSVFLALIAATSLSVPAFSQAAGAASKVGIIQLENAIATTKDGQKAAADLETKYAPRRKAISEKQDELQGLQTQYRNGANTMSDDARNKLARDIDRKGKILQRQMDDDSAEFEDDKRRFLQGIANKIQGVIEKYAVERGYTLVIDVSSQQTPVLYASSGIDITNDIVDLYDKSSGAAAPAGAKPAAAPAAKPAATPAPKPPAPAPAKK